MSENKLCLLITESIEKEFSRHTLMRVIESNLDDVSYSFQILSYREPIINGVDKLTLFDGINLVKCYQQQRIKRLWVFISCLIRLKPQHVLLGGYGHLENWIALVYCKVMGVPVTLWFGAGSRTTIRNQNFIRFFKALFVRSVDSAVTYGQNAKRYLMGLGVKEERVWQAVNVSDVDFFRSRLYERKKPQRLDTYIDRPLKLIFVGRLEKTKGLHLLISCLSKLKNKNYFCDFVGSGPLEELVSQSLARGMVKGKFWGQISQDALADRLVDADVYILPTLNDPFSRTLSEAIASGCFCLNSCYDDASDDLIVRGVNGFTFDPMDENEFLKKLELLVAGVIKIPDKLAISKSLIIGTNEYAKNIVSAISFAAEESR